MKKTSGGYQRKVLFHLAFGSTSLLRISAALRVTNERPEDANGGLVFASLPLVTEVNDRMVLGVAQHFYKYVKKSVQHLLFGLHCLLFGATVVNFVLRLSWGSWCVIQIASCPTACISVTGVCLVYVCHLLVEIRMSGFRCRCR